MLDQGGNNLDNDNIIGVMVAAPMIDDDNQPAPENLPSTEDSTGATKNINRKIFPLVSYCSCVNSPSSS